MEAPSRPAMEQLPERAGYHIAKFVDFYTEDVIRVGTEYAVDLKNRYTLLNLLQDVGLIRRFASQMPLLADRNEKEGNQPLNTLLWGCNKKEDSTAALSPMDWLCNCFSS